MSSLAFNFGKAQEEFYKCLADSVYFLTRQKVRCDNSYFTITNLNGDVPKGKGVSIDVIIRAYRKLGVDLQKEVHEDMKQNFYLYPKIWARNKTNTSIDLRRAPNLLTFLADAARLR